jgi:hypothetical protein
MNTGFPFLRILIIPPPFSIFFLPFSMKAAPLFEKEGPGEISNDRSS